MPALSPQALVRAIIDAVEQSGCSAVLTNTARQHPWKFIVTAKDGGTENLWVYAWTLTFGGRPSLPDEYRIQMTTVRSPLVENPNGPTILIGYEPDLGAFAGFDLIRHRVFTTGSPSIQIDRNSVRNALQYGLTFDRKSNDEIAIGIRPDEFMDYALNAEYLHRYGAPTGNFQTSNQGQQPGDKPAEISILPERGSGSSKPSVACWLRRRCLPP